MPKDTETYNPSERNTERAPETPPQLTVADLGADFWNSKSLDKSTVGRLSSDISGSGAGQNPEIKKMIEDFGIENKGKAGAVKGGDSADANYSHPGSTPPESNSDASIDNESEIADEGDSPESADGAAGENPIVDVAALTGLNNLASSMPGLDSNGDGNVTRAELTAYKPTDEFREFGKDYMLKNFDRLAGSTVDNGKFEESAISEEDMNEARMDAIADVFAKIGKDIQSGNFNGLSEMDSDMLDTALGMTIDSSSDYGELNGRINENLEGTGLEFSAITAKTRDGVRFDYNFIDEATRKAKLSGSMEVLDIYRYP